MTDKHPVTPPPPHLLKKFSAQAQDEAKKRNGTGYLMTFATLCIEWAMTCQSTPNDRQIRSSEIGPSPKHVQRWLGEFFGCVVTGQLSDSEKFLATKAANWGADQELEACISWIRERPCTWTVEQLRAARRPKLKSLAEEALSALEQANEGLTESEWPSRADAIRRALERLQELEGQGDD